MISIEKLMVAGTEPEKFKKGQIIINDGEPSNDRMYVILKGSVGVFKNYGKQGEIGIAVLSSGDFFGEMSLFLGKGRTATIVAVEDVTVFVIDRASVFEFLRKQPEAAFSFIQTLCTRLDSTTANSAYNYVWYEQNLTLLKHEKSELATSANTDPLTGVYNRRFFMENAKTLIDAAAGMNRSSFVVLLDLDYFKKINDTYGHNAGDIVLKGVVDTVSSSIRSGDIFARYGGDEFIILITCAFKENALSLVERIRQDIFNRAIEFEGVNLSISASAGVSAVSPGNSIDTAVSFADQALYNAKNEGRNKTVFAEK